MMRHDGRDTHYSAVGRVRRAIALRAADAMAPPEKTDGPHIQAAGSRDVRQRGRLLTAVPGEHGGNTLQERIALLDRNQASRVP